MHNPSGQNKATENRILEAAVQLFSRQGFKGSSTREIARLAGVNEVTVFRYFPRKKDLFWAATDSHLSRLRIGKELKARLESEEDPRVVVPLIVQLLVETVYSHPEIMRLLYLGMFELELGSERIFRKHLRPILDPLSTYLARCVDSGTIRCLDPNVATLGMLSTVVLHQALPQFLGNNLPDAEPYGDPDSIIGLYTNFWIKALVPSATEKAGSREQAYPAQSS
jgi:AcrR family transcriptional regulator